MAYQMLADDKRAGILTASAVNLTKKHLESAGARQIPVSIVGMENQQEFREVILEGQRSSMDIEKIE